MVVTQKNFYASRSFRYDHLVTTSPQSLTTRALVYSTLGYVHLLTKLFYLKSTASLTDINYHGVTGSVYQICLRFHRNVLICDY